METILGLVLTTICIAIPIGIIVIAAVLGTRAKLKYADRIRAAQARGAFDDLNSLKYRLRFRRLAVCALIGMLGMILSIIILALQLRSKFADYYGITLVVALLFGVMASTAGLLMQREINRRL